MTVVQMADVQMADVLTANRWMAKRVDGRCAVAGRDVWMASGDVRRIQACHTSN
jgi:hypothetical protein